MRATTTDYFKLHFIVFLWGSTAILGVLITIPAVEMVFYRTLIASVGMAVLLYTTRGVFKLGVRDIVKLILTGFIIGAHWISFFGAARISNVSVSLVGYATCSLWVAFLEPLAYRVKVKLIEVVLGLAVIAGLYVIFSSDFQFQSGLLLGIFSGLTAAIFSVINSKFVKRIPAFTITFYEMIGACMSTVLFFPFYQMFWAENNQLQLSPTWLDWFYISILAIACSVYAYSVSVELMRRLSVFFVQLTFSLEPVYGILMALILFGDKERMDPGFYIGSLIIVSSVIAYPFLKRIVYKPYNLPDQ